MTGGTVACFTVSIMPLAADIERAIKHDTDVILFNIDSKADTGRDDPILTVFLNVFNELLGYSPDHPHIADLERRLDEKGKLQGFNEAYKEISGNDWPDDRDAFYLNTDSIKSALSRVLEQSEAAFEKWLDDPESVFHLSPENFAEWVKEYLDRKGPDHRIVFLVDEIGQFIGDEALDYLVRNTFTKLSYLKKISSDPQAEIRAILTAPDTADQRLNLSGNDGNGQALKEVLDYVRLMESRDQRVVLNDLVESKFGKRPYGWPEWDIVLLVLRLLMAGEVSLVSGGPMTRDQIAETVKSPQKWRNITVIKRQTVDTALLQQARNLGKSVFSKMGPDGEDALYEFLRNHCDAWRENLSGYLKLAETGVYPGKADIESGLTLLRKLLAQTESFGFIKLFLDLKTDFEELSDQVADLDTFYNSQRPVWDTLKSRYAEFELNEKEIERDPDGKATLARMKAILSNPEPYRLIKEAEGLISKVAAINLAKVQTRRQHALERIDAHIDEVKGALDQIGAPPELRNSCLTGLQNIRARVEKEPSIAHIYQSQTEAEDAKDDALEAIEHFVRDQANAKPQAGGGDGKQATPGSGGAAFKKPRVVRPASLKAVGYLKSKEDIDAFIDALRAELEDALKNDEPIDIR